MKPQDVVKSFDAGWSIYDLTRLAFSSGVFAHRVDAHRYVYRCVYDNAIRRQRSF